MEQNVLEKLVGGHRYLCQVASLTLLLSQRPSHPGGWMASRSSLLPRDRHSLVGIGLGHELLLQGRVSSSPFYKRGDRGIGSYVS